MDVEGKILRLISGIDKGQISPNIVSVIIERLEKQGGNFNILYDVEDRHDPEYYSELLSDAKLGIYNRESLIRMAEIRYNAKTDKRVWLAIGGGIIIIVIVVLVFVLGRAKS